MPSVVDRVASRHLQRTALERGVAARYLMAAFISDKFFKGYEAELKKVFAEPLKRAVEDVPLLIRDRVIPLYEKFTRELVDLAPQARQTLEDRLEMRKTMLEKLSGLYSNARRAIASPYPQTSTLDHVLQHIEIRINDKLEKDFPTLGKAFKSEISIDAAKVKGLAESALRKATPEEKASIDANDDWSTGNLERKYGFFKKHVDGAVVRLVKKQKIDIDWLGSFAFIRDMLAANYAQEPRFSEFDIHGLKVVIDDATVTPHQHEEYIKEIIAAYQLLKVKKLSKAWYGLIFIECEKCDGRPGVAGHYNIKRDHIKLFSRPWNNTGTIIHELGHRYWFKFMSSTQREKFKDLVKVRTRPKPELSDFAPEYLDMSKTIDDARRRVEALTGEVHKVLTEFEKSRKPRMLAVDHFEQLISEAAMHFNTDIYVAVQTKGGPSVSPAAKQAWDDLQKIVGEAFKHLFNVRVIESRLNAYPDGPNDWNVIFKKERRNWIAEATDLLNVAEATAVHYVSECIVGYNDKQKTYAEDAVSSWQAEQDKIKKPVNPVSWYGGTNIDEAFAEAFLHYVLGVKMDADQEASFKAVLLDKDRTASKVAERWLTLAV